MFLTDAVHQKEPDLIKAINELCAGQSSDETVNLMKKLARPLAAAQQLKATYIFGTNFDVNFYN